MNFFIEYYNNTAGYYPGPVTPSTADEAPSLTSHRKGCVTLGQKFVVFDDSENRLFCLPPQFQHFLPNKASFDWRLFAMPGQAKHLTFRWSKTGRVDLKLDLFLGISIRTIWHRIKNIKLPLFWHYPDEIFWYMCFFRQLFLYTLGLLVLRSRPTT